MTLGELSNWVLQQKAVGKYQDGSFKGECVSVINQACWRVFGVPADAWGDAADWGGASNENVKKYFDQLHATTTLQAGDILVYPRPKFGSTGHIELYLGGGQSLEQNRLYDLRAHKRATLSGYTMVLRLKNKGGEIMNDPQDIRNIGGEIWGRGVDEQTVKNLTGKSWHEVIYFLVGAWPWKNRVGEFDNMRAKLAEKEAALAVRDTTIKNLKAELEAAKATSGAFTEQDRAIATETNSLIKVIVEWFKKIFNVGGK